VSYVTLPVDVGCGAEDSAPPPPGSAQNLRQAWQVVLPSAVEAFLAAMPRHVARSRRREAACPTRRHVTPLKVDLLIACRGRAVAVLSSPERAAWGCLRFFYTNVTTPQSVPPVS